MKIKLSMLVLSLQAVFTYSCFSQVSNDEKHLKENFIKIDSSYKNEMDLLCDVYINNISKGMLMQICFWDSLKTKVASKHFKENGKYNGPCSYWTADGFLTMEGYYMEGKKDSIWIYYLGKKNISKGKYKNGKKIGIWKVYDQNGKFEKEVKYGEVQNK